MNCGGSEHGDDIYLHSRCHPAEPTWAIFRQGGLLTLICAKCETPIATLQTQGFDLGKEETIH